MSSIYANHVAPYNYDKYVLQSGNTSQISFSALHGPQDQNIGISWM
jgi:hypothetical protein